MQDFWGTGQESVMLTNCDITVAREGFAVHIDNAEWQETSKIVRESSGVKRQFESAVFFYGPNDYGIKNGDFVMPGNKVIELSSLTGKAFISAAKSFGGKVIAVIYDNRKSILPHMELGVEY